MPNWAYALSKGLEAGANAGVGLIDTQLKEEAEERAANQKLQIEERMTAIREAAAKRAEERAEERKTAPMKRFSGLLNTKLGEQVPQEPEEVTRSTREGAKAAGLQDGLINMTREQVAAYQDPEMLAQFDKQMAADKSLAKEKVAGKTRSRTRDEAIDAALDEALANDPQAFSAGEALTKEGRKTSIEERKLASREKIEQAKLDQKERSDDRRYEAMIARIEATGSKDGGSKTALMQNAEYLKSLGFSDEKIEKFIFEKKELPLEDVAAKIMAGDSMITPQEAAQKAISLRNALQSGSSTSKPNGAPKSAAPYKDGTPLRGKDGKKYVVRGGVPVLAE